VVRGQIASRLPGPRRDGRAERYAPERRILDSLQMPIRTLPRIPLTRLFRCEVGVHQSRRTLRMLSDMLGTGEFHNCHRMMGGIAETTADTIQLDVDVRLPSSPARTTARTQRIVSTPFVKRRCMVDACYWLFTTTAVQECTTEFARCPPSATWRAL